MAKLVSPISKEIVVSENIPKRGRPAKNAPVYDDDNNLIITSEERETINEIVEDIRHTAKKVEALMVSAAQNYFNYKTDALVNATMTDEQKNAWGVIGGICGTTWDTDFPMTEEPAGTYTSDVLDLKAGEEFKVRQGLNWDIAFPASNYIVEADGNYKIQLTVHGEQGTVELIPQ